MHYRERDAYEHYVYKYARMHAVDMGVDTHKEPKTNPKNPKRKNPKRKNPKH